LVLEQGCYQLLINTGISQIKSLVLTDFCGENTLLTGSKITGNFKQQFNIGESGINPEYNLYPNPVKDHIFIEALFDELYQNAKFSILNLKGETIVPLQDLNGRMELNVSNLTTGIYIVNIETSRGSIAKKIFKL
jgi:hypothetical protein